MIGWAKKQWHQWKTWAALKFLARIQRITHRMPTVRGAVRKGRVLVLAPHMDDEVIGPGGSVLLHKRLGSTVGVVFTTDSSGPKTQPGERPITEVRKDEARQVAQALDLEIVAFLDFPDGSLTLHEPELGKKLGEILLTWKPDQIYVPFPADHHRDHQATAAGLALAIKSTDWKGDVWCYEIWSTLWPNVSVDISQVIEEKKKAIALHASQVKDMGYIEAAIGLNRYRGLKIRVPFAEAYFTGNQDEYLRVANLLNTW